LRVNRRQNFTPGVIYVKAAAGRARLKASTNSQFARRFPVMDIVMLVIGFAFFAASVAYVYACDQL